MVWLLIKYAANTYKLVSPNTYGIETWGSDNQDSIEKKKKYQYVVNWTAGNEEYGYDDTTYLGMKLVSLMPLNKCANTSRLTYKIFVNTINYPVNVNVDGKGARRCQS